MQETLSCLFSCYDVTTYQYETDINSDIGLIIRLPETEQPKLDLFYPKIRSFALPPCLFVSLLACQCEVNVGPLWSSLSLCFSPPRLIHDRLNNVIWCISKWQRTNLISQQWQRSKKRRTRRVYDNNGGSDNNLVPPSSGWGREQFEHKGSGYTSVSGLKLVWEDW